MSRLYDVCPVQRNQKKMKRQQGLIHMLDVMAHPENGQDWHFPHLTADFELILTAVDLMDGGGKQKRRIYRSIQRLDQQYQLVQQLKKQWELNLGQPVQDVIQLAMSGRDGLVQAMDRTHACRLSFQEWKAAEIVFVRLAARVPW